MVNINDGYSPRDGSLQVVNLESVGITVEIRTFPDGVIEADVLYGDIPDSDDLTRGVVNGIFLALTAFITEGFKDCLVSDVERLSECMDAAVNKVPSLVALLNELKEDYE